MTTSHIKNQTLEAQDIVRQIEEIVYDATTDRPFTGWDEDQRLLENGMKVADIISYVIFKAKAEALYDAAMKFLGSPEFLENTDRNREVVLDLIEQSKEMINR